MSDYNESTVSGSRYTRCQQIDIANPLGGDKYARFHEEDVLIVGDESIRRPRGHLVLRFDDPAAEIPLRDPTTWELTGETVTMGELYAAIASAYWHTALARDASEAAVPEDPV